MAIASIDNFNLGAYMQIYVPHDRAATFGRATTSLSDVCDLGRGEIGAWTFMNERSVKRHGKDWAGSRDDADGPESGDHDQKRKLAAAFEKFLTEEVNLNKSRIYTLTERVENIQTFLNNSGWKAPIVRYSSQGSWAHKTIIKPPGERGFDADLVVFVKPVNGWTAKDYVLSLRDVFAGSGIYKDKASLHTRCVALEYSGDFSIDVVPCVVNRPGSATTYEVCNRTDDAFEATDSEAYTRWLEDRNSWVGSHKLQEVIRLLKYLRDIKVTFSCKSILMTTLIGERININDVLTQNSNFGDVPTALRTLVGRLDDYLQARPKLHDVCNPVLPSENFVRHWDADRYSNFRDMINKYRGWIDEAYEESDEAESTMKWQRIFGDEFNKGATTAVAKFDESALVPIPANALTFQDAVQSVRNAGRAILANVRAVVPWMKSPPWRMASQAQVVVRATSHKDRTGKNPIQPVQTGQMLAPGLEVLFEAITPNGIPYSSAKDFNVQWQVVNTDRAAFRDNDLRGGFYRSDKRGVRWESTKYRGIHWIEAFVVRKRDRVCIGRSGRFFVVIE